MGKSITGAESVRREEPSAVNDYAHDAHIGIFFEGSGLNMVHKVFGFKPVNLHPSDGYGKDGKFSAADIKPEKLCEIEQEKGRSNGFTNVSMMYTLFTGQNLPSDEPFAKIYIEGAGTTDDNITFNGAYNPSGFAFGTGQRGVTALVSKAVVKVTENVNSWSEVSPDKTTLHFYVFGFSRGAACARLFCHLLTRDSGSILRCEDEFGEYRAKTMMRNGRLEFLEEYKRTRNITVDFLGIYDTVASIGILRRKDGSLPLPDVKASISDAMDAMADKLLPISVEKYHSGELSGKQSGEFLEGKTFHYDNVDEYGLYTDSKIKNICHLCAMDEFRENFALVNLGRNVPGNAIEVMIPGCHSDVGGSYLDGSDKSVINKYGNLNNRRKVCLGTYNEPPVDTAYVELSSFEKLGWVHTDGKRDWRTTEDDQQVKMYRSIKRGYSDIPLAMMNNYCFNVLKIRLFNKIPLFHDYSTCRYPMLVNLGNRMVDKIEHLPKGGRYWFFPTDYRKLRLKYLHFSSKNGILMINGPNYDEDDVMCRITYHGEKGAQETPSESIHFLYELSGTSMTINSGSNVPVRPCSGPALLPGGRISI